MKNNYKKGFTLIETLVAITVLMIAIAGPLTVASKAYTAATDARSQSIASNLAQEGLEYLNNMKDNRTWGNWVPLDSGDPTRVVPTTLFNDCSVECFDSTIRTDVPGAIAIINDPPTSFTRTYSITTFLTDTDQILATVTVSWKNGLIDNEVKLQEVLTNYLR